MNTLLEEAKKTLEQAHIDERVLEEEERQRIIAVCEDHASANTSGRVSQYNVCAVHPYYLELEMSDGLARLMDVKKNTRPREVLEEVLRNVDRYRYTTVLFDSHPHYTLKSHELVDEGLIDKVIFTFHEYGIPIHKGDMGGFRDSRSNYVGGAIADQCLAIAMRQIRRYAPFFSVRPIKDAITYHQPTFLTKVIGHLHLPYLIAGGKWNTVNDIVFHVPSRIYTWIMGVQSKELLQAPNTFSITQ